MFIVFAEYRGKRFLIDRFQTRFSDASMLARAWKREHPDACFFVSDKSPSHFSIDGGAFALFDEERLVN